MPFYLHTRNPLPIHAEMYEGHPWLLEPTWEFGLETAVYDLRPKCSGLFDANPKLNIVIGHKGEGLPFSMWRVDNRNAWVGEMPAYSAKRLISDYFHENFYNTTSENSRT